MSKKMLASALCLWTAAPDLVHAQSVADLCRQDLRACALGEYLQPKVMPCYKLPAISESEPIDFTLLVQVRLLNGVPVEATPYYDRESPTPFQLQIFDRVTAAVAECAPYDPVSGNAILGFVTDSMLLFDLGSPPTP